MANIITVTAEDVKSSIEIKRPKFSDLWDAYKEVNIGFKEVYKLIGGTPYALHLEKPNAYTNACALRMSRSFNYGKFPVKRGTLIPNPNDIKRLKGSDGLAYIFRVKDIMRYIELSFGKPEYSIKTNGNNIKNQFLGKQGIIIFKVKGWGDATGHVTLWDGIECSDGHCYFTHSQASVETTEILLWELK